MQRYGFGAFHKAAKIQRLKCIFEYNLPTREVLVDSLPNRLLPLCICIVCGYCIDIVSMRVIVFSIGKNQGWKYHVQAVQNFWWMVV